MIASTKPFSPSTSELANQVNQEADSAIKSTQRAATQAIDTLADKAHDVKEQVAPVLTRVAAKAEELARRGADAVRDTSEQFKDRAVRASDATVGYIKDEPVKAMLIAAAAGAALMALVALVSRQRD